MLLMTYGKTNKKNKAPKVTIPRKDKPFSEEKNMDDKKEKNLSHAAYETKKIV